MIHKRLAGAVVVLALAGVGLLLGGGPAAANHNGVTVEVDTSAGPCGETVFTTGWQIGEHQVDNTVLVVRIDGQVKTALVGTPLAVGPHAQPTTVEWRVWGGGERDYDDPPLTDLDALLAYLVINPDGVLDVDAPGVAWHRLYVDGCAAPQAPELIPADCDTLAELVVPEVEGVVYSHTSGPLNPGTTVVTAEPADGYAFEPDAETEWEFVVNAVPGCPGEPGQDGQDGADGADGAGGAGGTDEPGLPVTGSPVTNLVAAAGGFGAAGVAAVVLPVWWQRRRRNALLESAGVE
jgi:hypothetical protein